MEKKKKRKYISNVKKGRKVGASVLQSKYHLFMCAFCQGRTGFYTVRVHTACVVTRVGVERSKRGGSFEFDKQLEREMVVVGCGVAF